MENVKNKVNCRVKVEVKGKMKDKVEVSELARPVFTTQFVHCSNMLQTGCQANVLGMVIGLILFRRCAWAACLALQTNCQSDIMATSSHFFRSGTLATVGIFVWDFFY